MKYWMYVFEIMSFKSFYQLGFFSVVHNYINKYDEKKWQFVSVEASWLFFLISKKTCSHLLKQKDRSEFTREIFRPEENRIPIDADLLLFHSTISGKIKFTGDYQSCILISAFSRSDTHSCFHLLISTCIWQNQLGVSDNGTQPYNECNIQIYSYNYIHIPYSWTLLKYKAW